MSHIRLLKKGGIVFTLACAFLACTQPLPTAPDDGPLLAQAGGDITVTYECGNTFLFRNRSLDTLTLTWRVRGNHEAGTIFLPARPAGGEFSEARLTTQARGPLQVSRGGRVMRTVPNEHGAACQVVADTVPATAPDSVPQWIRADSSIGPDGFTKGILILVFKEGVTQGARTAFVVAAKATVVGGVPSPLGLEGFYFLGLNDPAALANPDSVVATLSTSPLLESISRDFRGTGPSWKRPTDGTGWLSTDWAVDPTLASGENWALEAMRLPLAWGCTAGDSKVRLGLVDHEFDPSEVQANTDVDHGAFVQPLGASPHHGTMMGNLMAARGGDGAGMTGTSQVAALVLRDVGTYNPTPQQLVTAVEQMIHDNVKVVNISYSWRLPYPGATILPVRTDPNAVAFVQRNLKVMIERFRMLRSQGRLPLLVFSAGNDTYDAYFAGYPALRDEFPEHVLTAGAANRTLTGPWGAMSSGPNQGSNFGDHVDLYAPGELVYTHKDGTGTIGATSGSSDAAALVTGVLGLALAIDPDLTAGELRRLAIDTTNWNNVMIPHAHSVAGDAPMLDAYGFLRNVASRRGAPLCGNQLWPIGNTLFASRGVVDSEAIGIVPGTVSGIFPYHGGRKVVVMDANWDWFSFDRDDQGRWARSEWDGVEEGAAASGSSIYGWTHDRDSIAFMSDNRLYLGEHWLDPDQLIATLKPSQSFGGSGGEQCVKEVHLEAGWTCIEAWWFGTSTYGSWHRDATPTGARTMMVSYEVATSVGSRSDAPVSGCYGEPLNEYTVCRMYGTSGSSKIDRTEIWKVDLITGANAKVVDIADRQVAYISGAEDGSGFAVSTSNFNGSGFGQDCRVQFYRFTGAGGAEPIGPAHQFAASCSPWEYHGGFGATRQQVSATLAPTRPGFDLQPRLTRVLGR